MKNKNEKIDKNNNKNEKKEIIKNTLNTTKFIKSNTLNSVSIIKSNKNSSILNSSIISTKENIHSKNNTSINNNSLPTPTIENLNSIHNSLELLNLQLLHTFQKQKISTDKIFLEKTNDVIILREYIFNLSSKLNSMINIQQIENYMNINYNKIVSSVPKLENILENLNDLKNNINYGLDRLYLEDNLVCDEKELQGNINSSAKALENLADENVENNMLIQEIRKKYVIYLEQLHRQKVKIFKINSLMENFKKNQLDEKIEEINFNLNKLNKKLEVDLFT
jgi:hypothetical protein